MKRADDSDDIESPTPTLGSASASPADPDTSGHAFLYIPDLSSKTRWTAHAVPPPEPTKDRHPLGFRRR